MALFALALGVVRLQKQRAYYLKLVAHNARWEAIYSTTERGWKDRLIFLMGTLKSGDAGAERQIAEVRQTIHDTTKMMDLFAERRQISERLASHPWEPVPPDPLDKKPDDDGPVLILEPTAGLLYEFSAPSIAYLALAPIVGVLVYLAFCMARRRIA